MTFATAFRGLCLRLAFAASLASAACAAAAPGSAVAGRPGQPPVGPLEASPTALPPPTAEEQALAGRLRGTVTHLAVDIGQRHPGETWNLATATDEVALGLERMGYSVKRQGFTVGDAVVQNLDVTVAGGSRGAETLVVGAHLDTVPGCPGADDNASGVAAVLELARTFRDRKPGRTLRFAFFTNEEAPHFQTEQMGSLVYAKGLVTEGVRVVGMISVESIGAYSVHPGSQRYPKGRAAGGPTIGDFLAVVGNEKSRALSDELTREMKRHATLPVIGEVLGDDVPGVLWSDHWSFWKLDIPAVMVTDTAPFRYAHYHRASDLPERLDFDRMARAVLALSKAVEALAGT